MNQRQNQIIDLLNDKSNWITGKKLASILSVTDRTIRSDIDKINQNYKCLLIESNHQLGYRINKDLVIKCQINTKELIPQTSNDRCKWIIRELLFGKNDINLIELQNQIYISEFSIDNDLKKVREILSEYDSLKLIRYSNHIRIEGEEEDKRKLYIHLLSDEVDGNFLNLNTVASIWKKFDIKEIKEYFESICNKYHFELRESSLINIVIHAGIAIDRMMNKNWMPKGIEYESTEDVEYQIAFELFEIICKNMHLKFNIEEVKLFAHQLKGSKKYISSNDNNESMKIVDKILKDINDTFGIDFKNDEDLKLNLETHIEYLLYRSTHKISINNVYLKEIKKKYPLVFELAILSGKVIHQETGNWVYEDELAFLALHLGTAYERICRHHKYRAIALLPHNQMLAKACIHKIENQFKERLEIVKVIQIFDENEIKYYQPDLILTMCELNHSLNIPTLQISLFFSFEDESRIFQLLNQLDKNRNHDNFVFLMKKLMKPDLFHIHEYFSNKEEIIEKLCNDLIHQGYANEEYKQDVFKREEISSTSFAYGFSVPHSMKVYPKVSSISIVLLDNPIKWGEYEVRLVILLSLREEDQKYINIFFDWLSQVVTDTNLFTSLLNINNFEEFYERVIQG